MFVLYKYLFQLQAGSILNRSAGKKLSEPGRHKDRSYKFFIRKFRIPSILNTDRTGRFALHVQTRVGSESSIHHRSSLTG